MRSYIRVFEVDPELAQGLDEEALALAREHGLAIRHDIDPGAWDGSGLLADEPGQLGVLVISGLLLRDVSLAGVVCTELAGPGDLLRPWDEAAPYAPVPVDDAWTALLPTTLAVLDRRFAGVVSRWPEVSAGLLGRVVMRSLWLGCLMGIGHLRRIDARVEALLWQIGYRWGRVEPEGVVVPYPFTHATLARLVGAGRPSVTRAVGALAERGVLERRDDGRWLLRGDAPEPIRAQAARRARR